MRLFEFVDSDAELLGLIKPILLRAKAEGATDIPMTQLLNDLDHRDEITPELMIDILRRHRKDLKNIVTTANVDSIVLSTGPVKAMTSKQDQNVNKMKNTALQQALDNLK
jgi:hypothetical protein